MKVHITGGISERDLVRFRRIARLASGLLMAWAAFFVYALTSDPDERKPEPMFFAALLTLIIAAAGLAWWRPRLGGLGLIVVSAIEAGAVVWRGPDAAFGIPWGMVVLGASLLAAPPLIVGVLWLRYATVVESARGH